jgi:hypothetical protein
MYDASDPRSALAAMGGPSAKTPTEFAGAEYAKFHETDPQESGPSGRTWYVRGQNFVIAYTEAERGGSFTRKGQTDEYVVLIPRAEGEVEINSSKGTQKVPGYSIAFIPPGDSVVGVPGGGCIVRLFTTRSLDLNRLCCNAASYGEPHPNVSPFQPWPEPRGGYRVRSYSLNVGKQEGRFGRIFRCTTFMVNYLDPRYGPRDITKLSPHSHDDFEQCSLAVEGAFIHDIRWPWITNMNAWRDDEHEYCKAPSVAVIPALSLHTSRSVGQSVNQLVDIFSPPRFDFSDRPGWVLNAEDYPMPAR